MIDQDTLLQGMIRVPVVKPTEFIQCGTYNTVYPPTNQEIQNDRQSKQSKRGCGEQRLQFEPWET